MPLLRNYVAPSPRNVEVPISYFESTLVETEVEVKDTNGDVIARRPSREVVRRSIPESEFVRHDSVDLYDLDIQLSVGAPLQRITKPYFKPSLDDATPIFEYLNKEGIFEDAQPIVEPPVVDPEPSSSDPTE